MAPIDHGPMDQVRLAADTFALMEGELVWFVPGAAVGVPGLLVLAFIGLQAAGAAAWLPFVRRMAGGSVSTRRGRRPAATG